MDYAAYQVVQWGSLPPSIIVAHDYEGGVMVSIRAFYSDGLNLNPVKENLPIFMYI